MKIKSPALQRIRTLESKIAAASHIDVSAQEYANILNTSENNFLSWARLINASPAVRDEDLLELFKLWNSRHYVYKITSLKEKQDIDIKNINQVLWESHCVDTVIDIQTEAGYTSYWRIYKDSSKSVRIQNSEKHTLVISSDILPFQIYVLPTLLPTMFLSCYRGQRTNGYNSMTLNIGGKYSKVLVANTASGSKLDNYEISVGGRKYSLYELVLNILEKYAETLVSLRKTKENKPNKVVKKITNRKESYDDSRLQLIPLLNTGIHGKHISPRQHERSGHVRHYKDGTEVWISPTIVNPGKSVTSYYR